MKLFEDASGVGELWRDGVSPVAVRYSIQRYQGIVEGSGLPIPGRHRIEGSIDCDAGANLSDWVGAPLTLRLSDGRMLGVTLADRHGRILSEGHGPLKCMCC
ncbi:MAG TPA: hypothetical protein VFY29_04525 [Terriglobia bacterium]|nr:hypothetical protein [Terriglobia bacterium]